MLKDCRLANEVAHEGPAACSLDTMYRKSCRYVSRDENRLKRGKHGPVINGHISKYNALVQCRHVLCITGESDNGSPPGKLVRLRALDGYSCSNRRVAAWGPIDTRQENLGTRFLYDAPNCLTSVSMCKVSMSRPHDHG